MSLQVWLPLNGDLHNQGLSNITMTNANATLDNNGKIGSCYSFDGSSNRCYSSSSFDFNSTTISISVWAKIDSTATTNGYICGLSQNNSAAFMLYYRADKRLDVIANGSSVNLNVDITNYVDSWHHYVVISTGTKILLYIDNIFKPEEKNYTATSFQSVWAYLGSRRKGADDDGAAYFKGQLNDVRIYNHALSPQEIEKISQGLVLHYQLNDTRIEETTNLLNLTQSHKTESVESINTATGTSATYSGEYITMTNTATGYFTFSAYINNITETPIRLRLGLRTGSSTTYTEGNTIASGKKGWSVVTVEKLPTHNDSITIGYFVNKQVQTLITNPLIYHAQLENHVFQTLWTPGGTTRPAIETVYDCSGFGNNGTITGSLSAAAGSPRYKLATQLHDQYTNYICTNNTFAFLHSNPFSISVWININRESLNNNSQHRHIFSGQIGLYISYSSNNAVIFQYKEGSTSKYVRIPESETLGGWHLFTIVYDENQNLVIYVDGTEKVNSQHNINLNSSNLLYIGSRANTSWADKYSDFRIYATALSNDQVNALFRTSMIVNSDGTTSPRGLS